MGFFPKFKVRYEFSKSVANKLRNKVDEDIVNAIEGQASMKKEIARVFQVANRRIQNIEKSGVYSPALANLGKSDIKSFSKFSVKGFSLKGAGWNALKREYAKAVSFLNQPTSLARGAKEFEEQMRRKLNVKDDALWKRVRSTIMDNLNSIDGDLFRALPYAQQLQEIYERVTQATGRQMRRDALGIAQELERQRQLNEALTIADDAPNSLAKMVKDFDMGW